jgi:hypothetical protein
MITQIPIEKIRHRADARTRQESDLGALADSITEVGLINPIRVRRTDEDQFEVVAGSHRLQACDLLGWVDIACIVVDDDDLRAELAMIDENLCRAELSPIDRAKQTARRKAIYLELHPETAHGGNLEGAGVAKLASPETPAFATATAGLTGQSIRAVQRDAERGEKVTDEAASLLRDTRLNTGAYLDKLNQVTPLEQADKVRRDLAPKPQGGIAGRYQSPPPAGQPKDTDRAFTRFLELADDIESLPVSEVVVGAGRRRSVLAQRAEGLALRMDEIKERLNG